MPGNAEKNQSNALQSGQRITFGNLIQCPGFHTVARTNQTFSVPSAFAINDSHAVSDILDCLRRFPITHCPTVEKD